MKKYLFNAIIFAGSLCIAISADSQPDRTYVVTDSVKNGVKWNFLRTLDVKTGNFSNTLLQLLNNNELQLPPGRPNGFSSNAVAAIALDQKNNKLYYVPMLTDELYYIDLKIMSRQLVTPNFSGLIPKANDQSNIITRMIICENDKGYALTNDGRHLISFLTKNNPAITDLGSLLDAPGNNENSIHTGCSNFGGDLISDDEGNLYLFTSGRNVFKVNINTKIAIYIGAITGLPAAFSVSSAAVDKLTGKIVIISNVDPSDVYTLNIKTLAADRLHSDNSVTASDLANAAILKTKINTSQDKIVFSENTNDDINLYPNPVTAKEFKIHFKNTRAGMYKVNVIGVDGSLITSKELNIAGKNSINSVYLSQQVSNGIYIVRVADANNKIIFNGKIFVQ